VRFVTISDTHCKHAKIEVPAGDVLVCSGDFTSTGLSAQVASFNSWLGEPTQQAFRQRIVIAGNHDITFHPPFYATEAGRWHRDKQDCASVKALLTNCTYLEDSGMETLGGIRVWGSPWQPQFCDWAFNIYTKKQALEIWGKIPTEIDIVRMLHSCPIRCMVCVCL
jgi:hypothetical protein